jgi:hypothetical protein
VLFGVFVSYAAQVVDVTKCVRFMQLLCEVVEVANVTDVVSVTFDVSEEQAAYDPALSCGKDVR